MLFPPLNNPALPWLYCLQLEAEAAKHEAERLKAEREMQSAQAEALRTAKLNRQLHPQVSQVCTAAHLPPEVLLCRHAGVASIDPMCAAGPMPECSALRVGFSAHPEMHMILPDPFSHPMHPPMHTHVPSSPCLQLAEELDRVKRTRDELLADKWPCAVCWERPVSYRHTHLLPGVPPPTVVGAGVSRWGACHGRSWQCSKNAGYSCHGQPLGQPFEGVALQQHSQVIHMPLGCP